MMETAIFIPSLNRPHKLEPLINNIKEATPEPHKIYAMVSDDASIDILKKLGIAYWRDEGDTRYVTRMNFMYNHTKEPFMFMGSDDVWFHNGWLTKALEAMKDNISVLILNDLLNPNGTHALIRRSYVDKQSCCVDVPKVLFHPDYGHNYADTEQFATAQHRGVLGKCEESIVEHLHWANNKSPQDETYDLSNKTSGKDQELFLSRQHLWS